MKYFSVIFSFLYLCFFQSYGQNTDALVLKPALNPKADLIAFSYQGDIFTSSLDGKNIKRLTIHEGYDTHPIFSPDGQHIAFESNRFGNTDIFTIPVNGGVPKRLTYHSATDKLTDYTAEGTIYFSSSRNFAQVEREPEVHSISSEGGTPTRLLNALGFDATLSPDKKYIAFTRGTCRIERETYIGPANRNIWIYTVADQTYTQLTTFEGQDLAPQWGTNNTLYYQSAESGKYNVHQFILNEKNLKKSVKKQLTQYRTIGIFSYSINKNNTTIITHQGDEITLHDLKSNTSKPVHIALETDYRFDPIVNKSYTNNADEIALSPNGKLTAFVIRGEIFIRESDPKKKKTINISKSPYRDQDIAWLNDATLIFNSDRNGINTLYSVSPSDTENTTIFTSLTHTIQRIGNAKKANTGAVISPDGKQIAFTQNRSTLIVASISEEGSISNKKVLLNGWSTPSSIAWSPDSKWISYSLKDLYFNGEIYIHKADNTLKPVNISMHPKSDIAAIWSADGSKIGFSSNRNNGDYDVWYVWLKKEDWEKTSYDWEEEEAPIEKDSKDKKDLKKIPTVHIDFKNIHERQVQVTANVGGEFMEGFSKDGKTIYYTTGGGAGDSEADSDLFEIKWNKKEQKSITKGDSNPSSITFSSKKDILYFLSKGKLSKITLKGAKKESLPFKATMKINYTEESNQIFEEAWHVVNDRFYDPHFHGQDWTALKNTYKPLALKASTRTDFKYIFNAMLGQINASHMGVYRGEKRTDLNSQKTGLLGIEISPLKNGVKITHVVTNSAADRSFSKLLIGDIITAINGEKISERLNFYALLENTSNEKVILNILRGGISKKVVIRPKSSNRTDNYKAWVTQQRSLTEKYSSGRLGYLHIQGMNWTSFERFERELMAAGNGKEGIVIDVRYNGGGWTTDYLMAVLTVKQHGYTVPRGAAKNLKKEHRNFKEFYPFSERLPLASWTKPSIALCNQNSYSNAEIFSHAYKANNLGSLVGTPTFGAVISTSGKGLIDGSYVRIPFRGWYVKDSGMNMELGPAVPDFIVENHPDEKSKNMDSQLKKAVNQLLLEIGE